MTSASPSTQLVHPAVLHAMLEARADELAARKAERENARSRRARARGGRGFIAIFGAVSLLMVGALTALAVHDDQTAFELDGDSVNNVVGIADDWDDIFNGTDSALVTTGIVPDGHTSGSSDDQFTLGSKDTLDVSEWHYKIAVPPSDKTDLENAYAALYESGGDIYLFLGADRVATNGNAKLGFWIFQDQIGLNEDGTFSGEHKVGDLLIESAYTGGGTDLGNINVWAWEGADGAAGHLSAAPVTVGVDCRATPPQPADEDVVCSVNNDEEITVAWPYQGKALMGNTPDPSHIFAGGFNETGINLSHYFPQGIPCFSNILAETRSAGSSVDSSTEDFVLGTFQTCGNIDGHKYLDVNGNGALDAGEPPLEGWTIELYESDGTTLIESQDTDSSGNVSFTDLEAGDYVICEVLESGTPAWINSDPGGSAPYCKNVTLALGGSETRNFGNGQPDIDVTKEASATDVCDGEEVTYTITVTNTGNVDLTNVDVSDDVLGDLLVDGSLAAGASTQFTPSSGPISGAVTNTVSASGDWDGATPAATDSASATVTGHDCDIEVTKSPSQDTICAGSSTLITYTYHVLNPGDVALTDVTVSDDTIAGAQAAFEAANGASDTLAVGADIMFTLDATLSATTTNIVTASGNALGQTPADTDTATATVTAVDCDIEVTKEASDATICTGSETEITYTYHVINAGDVALTNVTVSDDTIAGAQAAFEAANGGDTLAVGADIMFTLNATLSATTTNIVTASGDALGQSPADTDTATATVTAVDCDIDVTKSPSQDMICAGSDTLITYTYHVINPGDVALTGVTVSDDTIAGAQAAFEAANGASDTLAAGADIMFTLDATLSATTTNIVTASGSALGVTATDTATATVTALDCDIEVTKAPDLTEVCEGSATLVTYTYHVLNPGDVALTGVIVSDDTIAGAQAAFEAANGASDTLAVGADIMFTLTANISTTTTNTVTVSGNALGQTPADTDSASATVTAIPCQVDEGCTPGFWQGGLGVTLWDESGDDDWGDAGGAGSNPFVTTELFGAAILDVPASPNDFLGSMTMLEVVGSGGTNNWARKAARDAVAAYLNASFGIAYPYSAATVEADWDAAAALNTTAAYKAFHEKYAAANELGCPIGTPAPTGILIPLLPVSATGVLAYVRRRAARG